MSVMMECFQEFIVSFEFVFWNLALFAVVKASIVCFLSPEGYRLLDQIALILGQNLLQNLILRDLLPLIKIIISQQILILPLIRYWIAIHILHSSSSNQMSLYILLIEVYFRVIIGIKSSLKLSLSSLLLLLLLFLQQLSFDCIHELFLKEEVSFTHFWQTLGFIFTFAVAGQIELQVVFGSHFKWFFMAIDSFVCIKIFFICDIFSNLVGILEQQILMLFRKMSLLKIPSQQTNITFPSIIPQLPLLKPISNKRPLLPRIFIIRQQLCRVNVHYANQLYNKIEMINKRNMKIGHLFLLMFIFYPFNIVLEIPLLLIQMIMVDNWIRIFNAIICAGLALWNGGGGMFFGLLLLRGVKIVLAGLRVMKDQQLQFKEYAQRQQRLMYQQLNQVYTKQQQMRDSLQNLHSLQYSILQQPIPFQQASFSLFLLCTLPQPYHKQKLILFANKIQSGYNPIPYHNHLHAYDVAQMCFFIYEGCEYRQMAQLSKQQIIGSYVGCIVHDYQHFGFNNQYLVKSKHQWALEFKNISPLENHHASASYQMLQKMNPFQTLNLAKIRQTLFSMVLATDSANHGKQLQKLRELVNGEAFDYKSNKSKRCLMKGIIHGCDVSNTARKFDIAKEWALKIIQQFWYQGDQQRQAKLPITNLCDKYQVNFANSQINFINYLSLPQFQALVVVIPKLQVVVEALQQNRKKYEQLIEQEQKNLKQRKMQLKK